MVLADLISKFYFDVIVDASSCYVFVIDPVCVVTLLGSFVFGRIWVDDFPEQLNKLNDEFIPSAMSDRT